MKRSRQKRLAVGIGWVALACTAALSCSSGEGGRSGYQIQGTLTLPSADGKSSPQRSVTIQLLRGDVRKMFMLVYKTTPEAKARRALIASLEGARQEKSAAYVRAQAALAGLSLPADGSDTTDCETPVESKLADSTKRVLDYIRSFGSRLDELELPASDVAATLSALEEKSQQEEKRELRSLVEEYQNRHLKLQSSVLYDGRGPAWDRLCWRVSNDGHLNLARAWVSVLYNGRRLPIETVRLLWQIGSEALILDFKDRDSAGGTVYGLAAGASAKGCFFAADRSNLFEHREMFESQGFTGILSPRSGTWDFVFDAVSLTRLPLVETTDRETSASYRFFPPQALESVFAPELLARRPTFRARGLLEEIRKSPAGSAWEQAQKASLACHTVVEMKSELARLDEKLDGLRRWMNVDPVTEGRVAVVLEDMGGAEQEPTNAEEALDGIIAERGADQKATNRDGEFEFGGLKRGTYSVLARHDPTGLSWIEVVDLPSSDSVDLRPDNAKHAPLAKILAQLD